MPRYKMIAGSRPVAGREDDFNVWYDNEHLPQVVALKGFTKARRLKLAQHVQGAESAPYAAIYEIETDNLGAVLGQFGEAAASGRLTRSDAMDYASASLAIYEEFGDELLHEDVAE